MPIPLQQAPPESTKILIEESELARLRKNTARYEVLRKMLPIEFRLIALHVQRGFLTFEELIDYRIETKPSLYKDNNGLPPLPIPDQEQSK